MTGSSLRPHEREPMGKRISYVHWNCPRAQVSSMNAPPEIDEVEIVRRFLLRFADLMSNGSNSANLLLAAQLLETYVDRTKRAEEDLRQAKEELRQEKSNCADLTAQMASLSQDDDDNTVQASVSILRLATSQFESLARAFEKSGDLVSQAMCEASVVTMHRVLEAKAPANKILVFARAEAGRRESV
jgi:hypothetical protein